MKKFLYDVGVGALSLAVGAGMIYGTKRAITHYFPNSYAALEPKPRRSLRETDVSKVTL